MPSARRRLTRRAAAALLLASIQAPGPAPGAEGAAPVVAVLSAETGPFREALAGLREELKQDVPALGLGAGEPELPEGTRVVVTFGSKAALAVEAGRPRLVYALAPGVLLGPERGAKVWVAPAPSTLLESLRALDRGLHALAVPAASPAARRYVRELREAGSALGVAVAEYDLEGADDLPDALRALHGRADALLLPPDPALVTAASLPVLAEYSRVNRVPLFVPAAGLVAEGGTASIAVSFREMGRLAARAARDALEGARAPRGGYLSPSVDIVISRSAAGRVGLELSDERMKGLGRVVP